MLRIDFAPIQGYTDSIYRELHHNIFGGINCYYTPFIRLEHGEMRNKDIRDASIDNRKSHSFIPQIIINGIEEFNILTQKLISMGHDKIDINLGCPFILQTRKGRGAALLQHPELVAEIVDKINRLDQISFSLKMRLGMISSDEIMQILPIINNCNLSHITIHPRVASQQYKGEIDMESFSNVVDKCRHKIIYNGDINTVDDIKKLDQLFPSIDGIMIGRGLLSRPSLSSEYLSGEISDAQCREKLMQLHSRLYAHYTETLQGESQILMKLKTFWEYPQTLLDRKVYKAIKKSVNLRKYDTAISMIEV